MTKPISMSLIFLAGILFFLPIASSADLVMSAPPREKPDIGMSYYEPIAKQLSKILGKYVVYEHPKSWHNYTKKMQAGQYDIVFDGPHFAAWRMNNVKHIPVARLPGQLKFVVMAKKENNKANSIKDTIGKNICGLASPNLGTMSVFKIFDNPVIQPNIKIIKGGMKKVAKEFLSGNCEFAVVRDTIYNNLPAKQKEAIKIIARSDSMPNQTITVSDSIDPNLRVKISEFLVSNDGAMSATNLLTRFSKKKKFFIRAELQEYTNLEYLLQGVVYGW